MPSAPWRRWTLRRDAWSSRAGSPSGRRATSSSPGPPLLIGHEGVRDALADLPYLPEDAPRGVLISDMVAGIADIADEFEQAVASLGWTGGAEELLDELATGGALAYLRNADDGGAIGLLHAVTSPLACDLLLPWLAEEDRDAALGYVWQAVAALHVAYDVDRHSPVAERGLPAPTPWSTPRWPPATSMRSN